MKSSTRFPYTFDYRLISRAMLALYAALMVSISATGHAQSTASITPKPTDASRVSTPADTRTGLDLSNLARLVLGEVANFTISDPSIPVPSDEITGLDGQIVTLPQFRGKVVVLNFWATWCAPCKRELPSLDRLQDRVGTDDLAVLAVSIDRRGADKVRAYLDQVPLPHLSIYLDQTNKLGRSMGTFGLPTTVLVDRAGQEVGRLIGPAEWDSDDALALVRYVAAQRVGTGTSPE